MAAAMARGWAATEGGPEMMLFCDIDAGRAASVAGEVGGETRGTLADLGRGSDVVVLAVKPPALDDVASELSGNAAALISVVAATSTARLAEAFPGTPMLRVMPNQPVEVRRGVLCYVSPEGMDEELSKRLLELLHALGTLVPISEDRMDAAMAVMSCSPAYVALIAEALARAGARAGLDPGLAGELVARAIGGTAELLLKRDPAAIRRAVAPPGGATEAGLAELERGSVETAFTAAVNASLERFR
jgi:pyrroline-5-carboxylate reductase